MVCKKCNGFGYIQSDDGHMGIPRAIQCECKIKKALADQAERAWANLSLVPVKKSSPLSKLFSKNLVISSEKDILRMHLRTCFAKQNRPSHFYKVIGDHTLMSAWLGSMHVQGIAVADPDFQRELKVYSLEDLAESPQLLVVRLGTKMARNSAMPEVLVEAIEIREHLNKPTWLVEEPYKPLEEGHLSWSPTLEDMIETWEKVILTTPEGKSTKQKTGSGRTTTSLGSHKRVKL
jgi:hypothetical protein